MAHRLFLLPLALLALVLAACGEDDGGGSASSGRGTESTESAPPAGPTETDAAAGGCRQVDQPEPKPGGDAQKPKGGLDPGKKYRLTVKTNCGEFTIDLDQKAAPKTTASVVSLAEQDFYDGTIFHRIVPGFVIQGGDPTGEGTGGPGYSTVDKPPADVRYTKGVVAMAKTATEAPGTSGSQFYVVTGEDAGLPPEYAVIGSVKDGLDVVEAIGALGDAAEMPTQTVVIEDVAVQAS